MDFFDQEKNVEEYIKMAEGYDGEGLINILKKYLPEGSRVLELGMGPGADFQLLNKSFKTTGSDNSKVFLDRYRNMDARADLLILDAVDIETDQVFDCIYTNKVLHHLRKEDLVTSLKRQKEVILNDGILFHSFWYGDKVEKIQDLLFNYYLEDQLKAIFQPDFQILEINRYREMEEGDSIYVCVKKKS